MRTLTSGLTAAQQAQSGHTPAVAVDVGGTDYSSRILSIDHIERPYGGTATVVLDNHDKGITADHRGDEVTISYGYDNETKSDAPPLWVYTQRTISYEGRLSVALECIDLWVKLSLHKIFTGGGVELSGTLSGNFTAGMVVEGQTSGTKGKVAYVDNANSYILVTATSGDFTAGETVEYVNDSAVKITSITATEVGGGPSAGWYGGSTIYEILQSITSGLATLEKDSSDGIIDASAYNPTYEVNMGQRIIDVFQSMMLRTKCAARAENDGKIHIFDVSSAPSPEDYSYSLSGHVFKIALQDVSEVLPNTVYVYWAEPGATSMASYSGSATDSASVSRFGTVADIQSAQCSSDVQADKIAETLLARHQKEALQGTVEVPMNCGQQLWDYVKITDSRSGETWYGWVGGIRRQYDRGVYKMTLTLGGLSGAEGIPNQDDRWPNISLDPPILSPTTRYSTSSLYNFVEELENTPAYLPVRIDDVFSAVDYDTVSWAAGKIYAASGTEFSFDSGSLELTTDNTYYIYYDSADATPATLKTSTSFSDTIGMEKILLAFAKRSSDTDEDALLVTALGGKENNIYVTNLSAISADIGLITAGEIRVGTGTLGDDFTGMRMGVLEGVGYLAGYNNDGAPQWYADTDGKLYCGGGGVVMDKTGITLVGETLYFNYLDATRGHIAGADGSLEVWSTTGNDLNVNASKNLQLSGSNASLSADSGVANLVLESVQTVGIWAHHSFMELYANDEILFTVNYQTVRPTSDKYLDLGTGSYAWDYVYADKFMGDIDESWE